MEYIILDIETTGLDQEHSSIIEVGAVLISKNKISKEFQSYVRYTDPLPDNIKRLTGITESVLQNAPSLAEVINQLHKFINKRPVVSHNGFSFDFPMLERNGLKFAEKYDSIEFAFFVLPTSERGHSAKVLAERFSLGEVPHRALYDCKLEFEIICRLRDEYKKRNKQQATALKYFAERTGWWWSSMLSGKSKQPASISSLVKEYEAYRKKDATQDQLTLGTKPIDAAEVEKHFHVSAADPSSAGEYTEDRPEQRQMADIVTRAFNTRTHCVIEAGTGVGKSKAYLVPSVLFALRNGIPIIISTYTKLLQDQLFFKEIPHLRKTIHQDLRVAVIKGKRNYVCLQKFDEFADQILSSQLQRSLYEFSESETRITTRLAFLLLASWLLETERGDWDELPYWFQERISKRIEYDICNIDELCGRGTCKFHDEQKCFLAKARLRARDADIVIVNHAIVFSGIVPEEVSTQDVSENTTEYKLKHALFPNEARFLVIDEAHHIEDAATSAWEHVISQFILERLITQLYGGQRIERLIREPIERSGNPRLTKLLENFVEFERDTTLAIRTLFQKFLPACFDHIIEKSESTNINESILFETLAQTPEYYTGLTGELKNIAARLYTIGNLLDNFAEAVTKSVAQKILSTRARQTKEIADSISVIIGNDTIFVRYIERNGTLIEIKASPLSVAENLENSVYENFASVIMTSATLTINKKFHFFAERCGTNLINRNKISYHLLPSSFDYRRQALFLVPEGISYKNDSKGKEKHFADSLAFLERAIIASGGGALILCSSHEQVGRLYNDLIKPLSCHGIWLLRQSKEKSVSSVVREFAEDVNSVLVGTASLWQGIDVPGASLRALFIYKLPYQRPNEPVIQARCEVLDRRGRNGFSAYYEPLAILALKQGFGRLIRKATDVGIAVMLEEKLLEKSAFVKSLPEGVIPKRASQETICKELSRLAPRLIKSN